jgi:hypothetical protein
MMIVSTFAVPAMADVAVNVSWNSPTPNVNVLWDSQALGIWKGAQGSVAVQGAGTAAYGTVTFNTTNDIQPVATNFAVFVGGTYEAAVNYQVIGGFVDATNSSYSMFNLGTPYNSGAVYQGFQATQPVETTGGQNVSTVSYGMTPANLTMNQYVSSEYIGTFTFSGEASGWVHGDALNMLNLLPDNQGGMQVRLAGSTGTTTFGLGGTSDPLNLTVYPGDSFTGTGPMGYSYGPTIPAYSVTGVVTNF